MKLIYATGGYGWIEPNNEMDLWYFLINEASIQRVEYSILLETCYIFLPFKFIFFREHVAHNINFFWGNLTNMKGEKK